MPQSARPVVLSLLGVATLVLAVHGRVAEAENQTDPGQAEMIRGDPEFGAYLSGECTTCHQIGGTDDGIPSITHWPVADFVVTMRAYKNKDRPHPVMQMIAGRLSDEEIAALAAYFNNPE
ncbi:c-type cytochrome [Microbulbifer sp. S227A]|uniref:c-type cytochrome n=1 Tax=Microbulbifer sp. S227A TaxID=3415131 RepID=UPI003C7C90DB